MTDCPTTPLTVAPPASTIGQPVVIDIVGEELDVTATGLVAVDRCTATGPITVFVLNDENHAGTIIAQTDNGTNVTNVIGWMSETDTSIQPAATLPATVPGRQCEVDVEFVENCLLDDVNGDGSLLVPYVEVVRRETAYDGTITNTTVGTYTDGTLNTPYTPTNPVDPATLGNEIASYGSGKERVTGPYNNYTPTPTTYLTSVTVTVISGPVTITDSFGTVSTMDTGQTFTWNAQPGHLPIIPPRVTVPAGSVVDVIWVEPNV